MPSSTPESAPASADGRAEAAAGPTFVENFPGAVDAQWRVTVPAAWRFQDGLKVHFRLHADHLEVLPPGEFERFRKWANETKGPDRRSVMRAWASSLKEAEIDQAGRLTLPREWAPLVGIEAKSKAMLVGVVEFFEVWSAASYEADKDGEIARGKLLLGGYG